MVNDRGGIGVSSAYGGNNDFICVCPFFKSRKHNACIHGSGEAETSSVIAVNTFLRYRAILSQDVSSDLADIALIAFYNAEQVNHLALNYISGQGLVFN